MCVAKRAATWLSGERPLRRKPSREGTSFSSPPARLSRFVHPEGHSTTNATSKWISPKVARASEPQPGFLPRGELLDEVLVRLALVNHDVPFVLLDHVLDVYGLVTGNNCETVSLTMDELVLREGHQDAATTPIEHSALTREGELVRGIRPGCALAQSRDLLIHRTQQRLVPSLTLEPLLHVSDDTRLAARAPRVRP
jgi:hypothetical protein